MPLSLRSCGTVEEAVTALQAGRARYVGGGTLVVRAANEGDLSFDTFVRTTDKSLRRIDVEGDEVVLGSAVTMAQIAAHPALAVLAPAARAVGGPAIRNMATVGGNLFAPAPYGDFAVALLALGAEVDAGGAVSDIEQFLKAREDVKDIVRSVRFKTLAPEAFRFLKVSRVKPKGVSVLSIAAVIERKGDGTVASARIALGCMADRPIRALAAERALVGATLDEQAVARAVEAVSDGIAPITDPVASAWYRAEVLPVHFLRLLSS